VQAQLARAEALLGSARAYLYGALADAWAECGRGRRDVHVLAQHGFICASRYESGSAAARAGSRVELLCVLGVKDFC
jgi:hypothetical protein